jgi:hypothetical protein
VKAYRRRSPQLSSCADAGVVCPLTLLVQVLSTDQRKTIAGIRIDFYGGKLSC